LGRLGGVVFTEQTLITKTGRNFLSVYHPVQTPSIPRREKIPFGEARMGCIYRPDFDNKIGINFSVGLSLVQTPCYPPKGEDSSPLGRLGGVHCIYRTDFDNKNRQAEACRSTVPQA